MSNATKRAPRSVDDLRPADRERLERAQRRLREAVATYEPFLGATLAPCEVSPVHDAREMAAAQAEVHSAEGALWQLREELLGWARPA